MRLWKEIGYLQHLLSISSAFIARDPWVKEHQALLLKSWIALPTE